jgi:hypothetical protein
VTLFGIVIEVNSPALNASDPIEVTPLGISAAPAQFVFPVTTLFVIVNVPPALQFTVAAQAGGATRVAPSKANTATSDNFLDFSNTGTPCQ